MAKYLVTGGCGFIGAYLVTALIEQGHDVRVLDDMSSGNIASIPAEAQLLFGTVTDTRVVDLCMKDVDGCFHLAAVPALDGAEGNWAEAHQTNLTGSLNIFNAARAKGTPVVYASSASVYGDNAAIPLSESDVARPCSTYGADKLACELHARATSLRYAVPTTGLRLFNVYGPGQSANSPYTGFLNEYFDRALNDQAVQVEGDGQQMLDLVYVDDVVQFFLAAMANISRQPRIFNVCSGHGTTLRQAADLITRITRSYHAVEYIAAKPGHLRFSSGDIGQSYEHLGLAARTSLGEGLRSMLADYRGARVSLSMAANSRTRLDNSTDGLKLERLDLSLGSAQLAMA